LDLMRGKIISIEIDSPFVEVVYISNLNGMNRMMIANLGNANSLSLTVDSDDGLFFFTTLNYPVNNNGIVSASYLSFSGTNLVISNSLDLFMGADLDFNAYNESGGNLYWTSQLSGSLWTLDIANRALKFIQDGKPNRLNFAIDREEHLMYWPEANSIRKSNLDGTNETSLLPFVAGKSIEVKKHHIYFGNSMSIRSCLKNGSDPQTVITSAYPIQDIGVDTVFSRMIFQKQQPKYHFCNLCNTSK